jgi:hypothetical protein
MPRDVCWGDYKLEPTRVAEVTSLMARALKRQGLTMGEDENRYIDRSLLDRFLEAIPDEDLEPAPKVDIMRLQAALRSIMVLRFCGRQIDGR